MVKEKYDGYISKNLGVVIDEINYIVVDRENELVIVTRWLEPSKLAEFLKLVYNSID